MTTQVVKTICQICTYYCGLDVTVEDGCILNVEGMLEHPANQGRVCAKGLSCPQLDYRSINNITFKQRQPHPFYNAI